MDLGLWVSKLLDLSKGEKKKSGKQEQKRKATLFIFAWLNLGVSGHEQKKPNMLARGSLRAWHGGNSSLELLERDQP